ncbi:MFS transporter [Nitratifractor sp.]
MINKNVIALGFVSFFTDMASAMVTSILPIFIVYTLDQGVDKLGYVVAIATFVSYAFRILFGYLSDRLQIVKPFVVAGYLVSAVTKPMLAWAVNWQQVALLRGLERMGKAIRAATKDSLISAYSEGKSGRSFGFHKMMDVAGEMSGALIAFTALYWLGKGESVFRELFAWTLVPGILAVLIVLLFVRDVPYQSKKRTNSFDWRADRGLLPLLFLYFGFVFFLFNDSFFLVSAKEAGYSVATIPLLMVLYNFIQTLLSYFFGVQIDRTSPRAVLGIAMLFGLGAMGALYWQQVIVGFILLGIFTVAGLNAIRACISDEAVNKGTVYGIFYGGVALFGAAGATVIGLVWKQYGEADAILFSMAGLTILLLAYLLYFWRDFKASKILGQ